jgi:ubiquitin-like protein Pup
MTERERTSGQDDRSVEETQDAPTSRGEDVADKIDDLLEEIDSVLEENAEEFVKNYVQKGGE